MSKLKRSVLKSVVKECLLEILSEGINSNTQATSTIQPKGNASAQQSLTENTEKHTQSSSITDAIAGITDDPILAAVLGDTARTTLVEQTGADRQGQMSQMRTTSEGGTSDDRGDQQEPDGASHWSALAFADKK
jgi:hypothetical protein